MLWIKTRPCSCLCVFYIQDLDKHLQSLTAQFERAAAEKLHCQEEVTRTTQTIELASRLVGGLQVLHELGDLGSASGYTTCFWGTDTDYSFGLKQRCWVRKEGLHHDKTTTELAKRSVDPGQTEVREEWDRKSTGIFPKKINKRNYVQYCAMMLSKYDLKIRIKRNHCNKQYCSLQWQY